MLDIALNPQTYSIATSSEIFDLCLTERLGEAVKKHDGLPLLHLSLHGNTQGIQFTNDESLNWNQLRLKLLPLIRGMNGNLIICMSSCFGASGCRMAMHHDNEPTFSALIGNNTEMEVSDAALAYATFYSLLFKGKRIDDCVKAMCISAGNSNFDVLYGQQTKQDYIKFLKQQSAVQLQNAVSGAAIF